MRRVDLIVLPEEFDSVLWYLDGEYLGHDDQWDLVNLAHDENPAQIELRSWRLKDGLTGEEATDVIWARRSFTDIEDHLALGVR